MSSHTTYFCDHCNSDRDIQHPEDEGHAICHDGLPIYAGWAEFQKHYTGYTGRQMTEEYHVCAHCLADPDLALDDGGYLTKTFGAVSSWDTQSAENVTKGRAHAERFQAARESLARHSDPSLPWWKREQGVRQVFGDGQVHGPRPLDLWDALRLAYERDGLDTWTGAPKEVTA